MYTFEVTTLVQAPPTRCFDLNRSVDAHLASTRQTGERVVAGRSTGLFELGDEVTWEARHLHLRRRLTIRITTSNRPTFSQEQMIHGPFRSFEHDHIFDPIAGHATRITDVIRFAAPFGPIGWLAERLIVGPHLKRFITTRASALKQLAESEGWRAFVSDSNQSSYPARPNRTPESPCHPHVSHLSLETIRSGWSAAGRSETHPWNLISKPKLSKGKLRREANETSRAVPPFHSFQDRRKWNHR